MKHDFALDYIKGLAILMVIFIHSLLKYNLQLGSILHIEQAVPLFLIVSAYLYFSKVDTVDLKSYFSEKNVLKLINRIFVPYLIFELVIVAMQYYHHTFDGSQMFLSGGIGMGSYYPWLYFQFWASLPLMHLFLLKFKKIEAAGAAMILLSVVIELVFGGLSQAYPNVELFDSIWRLFIGRYVFIIFIAYMLVKVELKMSRLIFFVILGALFTVVHRYHLFAMSPVFYSTQTYSWNGVHWPMYFYTGFLFRLMYKYLPALPENVKQPLQWLGHNSWEVFLAQMLFFSLFTVKDMPVAGVATKTVMLIVFGIFFSVLLAIVYKWLVAKTIVLKNMLFSYR